MESLVEIPTPRVISLSCPILHGLAHDGLFLGSAWSCEILLFILFFFFFYKIVSGTANRLDPDQTAPAIFQTL